MAELDGVKMPEFPRDVDMNGITREAIMSQFGITIDDFTDLQKKSIVVEKLFCAAILNQGTDFAAKTLANYNKLKDILYGK